MREEQQPDREGRLPGEVVETYRQPLPGEVVERYTRPLPGRGARPALSRPRRRTGVWIFAVCLTVVLGIAAGTGIWALLVRPAAPGGRRRRGGDGRPGGGRLHPLPIPMERVPPWRSRRTAARP